MHCTAPFIDKRRMLHVMSPFGKVGSYGDEMEQQCIHPARLIIDYVSGASLSQLSTTHCKLQCLSSAIFMH